MQTKTTYIQHQIALVKQKQPSSLDTLISCQQLVPRLQEILSSILDQKQKLQDRFAKERSIFEEKIDSKQEIIMKLRLQNDSLKDDIAIIQQELTEKRRNLQVKQRQSQFMQKKINSMRSVMTYLEQKNKELSYEVYQMKKLNSLKNPRDSTGKKLVKLQSNKNNYPRYIFNNLEQQSIFQYTGVLDHDLSINQLHRTESSPNLQCFTIATQVDSSIAQKELSIGLKGVLPVKKEEASQRNVNAQKMRSIGQIFDVQSTKNSEQISNSKRTSISKKGRSNLTIKQRKKTQVKERVDKVLGNCCFKSEVNLTKRGKRE